MELLSSPVNLNNTSDTLDKQKRRMKIKQKVAGLQNRAADSLSDQVKLSHFNHGKNKPGKRVNIETSSKLETVEQLNSEQPLDNDSLGG